MRKSLIILVVMVMGVTQSVFGSVQQADKERPTFATVLTSVCSPLDGSLKPWLGSLKEAQNASLNALFQALDRGKTTEALLASPAEVHALRLQRAVFNLYVYNQAHESMFSPVFIARVRAMDSPIEACEFIASLWAMLPWETKEVQWFSLIQRFWEQVPAEEVTLANLNLIVLLTKTDWAGTTKGRLRSLENALDQGPVNTKKLQDIYNAPEFIYRLQGYQENTVYAAKNAVIATACVLSLPIVVPYMLYGMAHYLLSGHHC